MGAGGGALGAVGVAVDAVVGSAGAVADAVAPGTATGSLAVFSGVEGTFRTSHVPTVATPTAAAIAADQATTLLRARGRPEPPASRASDASWSASSAATTRARLVSDSPAMRSTHSPTSEGRTAGTHASMSSAISRAVA